MTDMHVALFVPCITAQMFPETGLAAARVLRHLGVSVSYPGDQTCCGQPAYNTGYREEATDLARHFAAVFQEADTIVSLSGSCTAMVKNHYGDLDIGGRVHEFSTFLTEVLGVDDVGGRLAGKAVYHPSCHGLRELGIQAGPLRLLNAVDGLEVVDLEDADICCGFGGTFAVKFPELSTELAKDKCTAIRKSGADWVVAIDSSCLMQIGGYLQRHQERARPVHLADLLARSLETKAVTGNGLSI